MNQTPIIELEMSWQTMKIPNVISAQALAAGCRPALF